jgi:hypothetical protein
MEDILTDVEKRFLSWYRLGPEDVYDGRYTLNYIARANAKSEGKTLVLGGKCRRAGHRLRTRAGHCAQCDPKKIKFQERYNAAQICLHRRFAGIETD